MGGRDFYTCVEALVAVVAWHSLMGTLAEPRAAFWRQPLLACAIFYGEVVAATQVLINRNI